MYIQIHPNRGRISDPKRFVELYLVKDRPGIYKIRKLLQNQDDYSLQKPVRRNFKRAKVIVSGPNEQLDVETLKNKTAKEVERGLMIILNQAKPRKIRTNGGSEFNNR